jgi:hypothetical protein
LARVRPFATNLRRHTDPQERPRGEAKAMKLDKQNLDRKWQIKSLLSKGLSPAQVGKSLGITTVTVQSDISWLVLNGYLYKVAHARYRASGKARPWAPANGKAELLGKNGNLLVVCREHPLENGTKDYCGLKIMEGHLEVVAEGLPTLVATMSKFPKAIPLTAVTLSNLRTAVQEGISFER